MGLTERIERGDDQENIGNRGENKKGKEIKRGHKDTLKQIMETDHEIKHNCPDDNMPR